MHNAAMRTYDVIVIGAGAAGLMCAGTVAPYGRSVLVLDHADKPGKKILISGGGRCNFTNRFAGPANYVSNNPHFCKSALARFSAADFIDRVERSGIRYHERDHGQLFCDDSARDILDMLLAPCHEYGVNILLNCHITSVTQDDGFLVCSSRGEFRASSLVIATGGLSIPKMGASPFGLKIAESFGLKLVETRAALAPFTFTGGIQAQLKSLAGISLNVTASCNGKAFTEAMLFTHRGLSGPAMLQISSYWLPGDTISVDLMPGEDALSWLGERKTERPKAQLSTILAERLPKRLAQLLAGTFLQDLPMQRLSEAELGHVATTLHGWKLKPAGTEGYRTAEATVGGVDTNELSSKTMAVKKVPGLYFVGEVVDVTGHLGGFNFQWAWASGHAAAMAMIAA